MEQTATVALRGYRSLRARTAAALCGLLLAAPAAAQVPPGYSILNSDPAAANAAFPAQNAFGPRGQNYQVNYPYPGQCVADSDFSSVFPTLPACSTVPNSFTCPGDGISNQSAGGWSACGAPFGYKLLSPLVPDAATPKFVHEMLNPPDFTPAKDAYPGADYYELGVHEAWGFQALAGLGAFPDPTGVGGIPVPNGMQWTGITCNIPGGCTCPAGLASAFARSYCPGGVIPQGAPLFTPVWGIGQMNMGGTAGVSLDATDSPWSQNRYIATWPSLNVRANKGTPVVVKWVNELPNNHVLCTHPEAADWPCSIDRTFMGVKARIDPAALQGMAIHAEGVNPFGSPQQPDNSWVTHLHGGEIPPSTDGFAELWFGNATTAAIYNTADATSGKGKLVSPPFEAPVTPSSRLIELRRPIGNSVVYTYPMVQEEMTIWFHDHTLGKTHHNVIAGPAGFFPIKEPLKHGGVSNGRPTGACPEGYAGCTTDYTWLDPVTEPRTVLNEAAPNVTAPTYDLFMAIQDRAFNEDGTINLSNGLGQTLPPPPLTPGMTPVTIGPNPLVHPTWVPEYFGDFALVNGVVWPKKTVESGWYRLRIVNGSDSRCYVLGFQGGNAALPAPAPGAAVDFNTRFWVIANDQGYLQRPVRAPANRITTCPGERYELLVDFANVTGATPNGPAALYMVNNASAPFPGPGGAPQDGFWPDLNVIMKFEVTGTPGVKSCGATIRRDPIAPAALSWDPNDVAANLTRNAAGYYTNICMPADPSTQLDPSFVDLRPQVADAIVRQVYLNERVDGMTGAPFGMQLNGVPFEYKVTETPQAGTVEVWQFINLTVDAHPIHPHLVKHQIVQRQALNVGAYKAALCGSATCQPGPVPGNEMQVIPDVNAPGPGGFAFLGKTIVPVTPASFEGGWKDATQVPPGMVTTIIAEWTARWAGSKAPGAPAGDGDPNAPGTTCDGIPCSVAGTPPWTYEDVFSGPYVWHCHINTHEDSEMMRSSLVVPGPVGP